MSALHWCTRPLVRFLPAVLAATLGCSADGEPPTAPPAASSLQAASTGGFAFIFDAAVSSGSTIRAQFDSLPGKPQIAGIVRSCVHICGTQHRIGVEYQ